MKLNKQEKTIIMRMDKRLWQELYAYAQSNDLSIAQSARKAIAMFIKEQK